MITLRFVFISLFTPHYHGQPVFDCPEPVGYGESSNLTCLNLKEGIGSISNPAETQVTSCNADKCHIFSDFKEKINASIVDDIILLTVHNVNQTDEGEWTCMSGKATKCSFSVYKHPSCNITSFTSTNDLTVGQDLTLKINLRDYYCTNSITWNLQIGGRYQIISEFREVEETDNITSRAVTYSPTVTSSFTGPVKLTCNCNDETYNVSCSGVEELKLRDPPHCTLSSEDDTKTLTTGNNLTLEATIGEYPCTSGIEYALLSGSLMVTEFIRRDGSYSATFKVKPVYLNKQLHLKFTCNNVSATTRTAGVTILLTKGSQLMSCNYLGLIIGLSVGSCFVIVVIIIIIIVIITILIIITVIICLNKRKKMSRKNDAVYSDVRDNVPQRKSSLTSNETYAEVSDAKNRNHVANFDTKGNRIELTHFTGGWDKSRPRSVCEMVENVAYESVDKIKLNPK